MRRAFLMQGDKSTTGGIVLEGFQDWTHEGTPLTFIGAAVWCNRCLSHGAIALKGPHNPATMMGKQQALEGDICLCKCNPPPVMLASQDSAWHVFDAPDLEAMTANAQHTSIAADPHRTHDQRFQLLNPGTGFPFIDAPYRIVTEYGDVLEGRTDAQGYTDRVTGSDAIAATLHVLEEVTPLNPDWDNDL